MNLQKAEQAILNAIYAATAWLLLDLGLLFKEHGKQAVSIFISRPEMAAGAIIVIACIAGLMHKSRVASVILFLLFLLPLLSRIVQGMFPSTMMMLFFLLLLYLFLSGVIGTFRYHYLKTLERGDS
jgi:hypothetical protein